MSYVTLSPARHLFFIWAGVEEDCGQRTAGLGLRACMMKYFRCICGGGRPAACQWGQRGCRPGMKRAPAAVRPLVPLPHRTGGRGWGGGGGLKRLKKVAWLSSLSTGGSLISETSLLNVQSIAY